MEEVHRAEYGGRASMPSPGVSPSYHLDVFTDPEVLQTLSCRGIYGGFIM